MAITIDDIEALRRRLTELPRNQPREVSKQESIALLASELGAARRRGYSPEELARLLSEQGVAINAATLRGYLRRKRRSLEGRRGTPTGWDEGHINGAARERAAAPARATAQAQPTPIARSAKEAAPSSARETQGTRGARASTNVEC
jgi:hypothetical protein